MPMLSDTHLSFVEVDQAWGDRADRAEGGEGGRHQGHLEQVDESEEAWSYHGFKVNYLREEKIGDIMT